MALLNTINSTDYLWNITYFECLDAIKGEMLKQINKKDLNTVWKMNSTELNKLQTQGMVLKLDEEACESDYKELCNNKDYKKS